MAQGAIRGELNGLALLAELHGEAALTAPRARPLHHAGKSLYFGYPFRIPHNGRMVRSVLMRVGPARDPLFFVTARAGVGTPGTGLEFSRVVAMESLPAWSAH